MNIIWRNVILSVVCLELSDRAVRAQVINFDVRGGAGAANYSGQGAYAGPGHNYWNPVVGAVRRLIVARCLSTAIIPPSY
jgi:hypothetical protein